MSPSAFSRSLRILSLAWAASMLSGCAIPATWEKVSPDPEGYRDTVTSVTSASQRDDGSVVICVTGRPATTPSLFSELKLDYRIEAFSLILPAHMTDRVSVVDGRLSLRRYDLNMADVAGPCPDSGMPETALPVHAVSNSDLGYSQFDEFDRISDAALAELFEHRTKAPAIYVFTRTTSYDSTTYNPYRNYLPKFVYVAPEARFDGARAVLIEPAPRPVKGNPAYVVLLPVAAVADVLIVTFYVAAVVAGIDPD